MVPALQYGERRHLGVFGIVRHIEREKSDIQFWAVDKTELTDGLQGSGTASKRGRQGKRTSGAIIPFDDPG